MYKVILLVAVAFVGGIMVASPNANAQWDFFSGTSADNEDRPHSFARYFQEGDIFNECLWDVLLKETCERGIIYDNQVNMNNKLNYLLEKSGYDFEE